MKYNACISVLAVVIFTAIPAERACAEYSPTLGRWLEEDTTGAKYVDGMNLYQGLGNNPLNEIDPFGTSGTTQPTQPSGDLTYTTVAGPQGGDCGAALWRIQWALQRTSNGGGYVIQKVNRTWNITDCDGNKIDPMQYANKVFPFWEAWRVDPNSKSTDDFGNNYSDRNFNEPFGSCTKGSVTFTASAEFFENLQLPAAFFPNNPYTGAGLLPSTTVDPGSLPGGTGSVLRKMTITWNCCPKGHVEKSKVITN